MINMHTTDMMTLPTGDVEAATKELHSATAAVSFQSIVAAEGPMVEPQADEAELLLLNDSTQESLDFFTSKLLFSNDITIPKDTVLPELETALPAKIDLIDDETSLPVLPPMANQNDQIIRSNHQVQQAPEMVLKTKETPVEGVVPEAETEPETVVNAAVDLPSIGQKIIQESPQQTVGAQQNTTSLTYNQASNIQPSTPVEPQTDSSISIPSDPTKLPALPAQYLTQSNTTVMKQGSSQAVQSKGETDDPTYDALLPRTTDSVEGKGQITTDKITVTDLAAQQKLSRTALPLNTMTGADFSQAAPATSTNIAASQINRTDNTLVTTAPSQPLTPTSVPLQLNELAQQPSLRRTLIGSQPQESDQLIETDLPVKTPTGSAEVQNNSTQNNSTQNSTPTQTSAMVQNTEALQNLAVDPTSGPDLVSLENQSIDGPTATRQDSNLNRPEVMRHVAQQMASVARQSPDRPVELILNPEELGRVRLTFTTTDGGINVAVIAERGETTELLRRHIETLAEEFRELGYKDVSFDFSGNGAGGDQNGTNEETTDQNNITTQEASPTEVVAPVQLSLTPSTGLDLRL